MNELVQYKNVINSLQFKDFNSSDLNFFMGLCAKLKNQSFQKITIPFQEIRQITGYTQTSDIVFIRDLKAMNKKLLNVTGEVNINDDMCLQFTLFDTFATSKVRQELTVSVNSSYTDVLNGLVNDFTAFQLQEYVNLSSKYSRLLFQHLKQFKITGLYRVDIDKFRFLMCCPSKYDNKIFIRDIVKPSVAELDKSKCFHGLTCEPIRAKKRGAPIIGLEFKFKKEKYVKIEDLSEQQQTAIEHKKNNTYKKAAITKNKFHYDGERDFDEDIEVKLLRAQGMTADSDNLPHQSIRSK